ncbi:right-handed parallel beta-helix repeat-containing protein [Aminobacter anthyllidis]|uniref:right-handed parallel beta-helix repeat-containing protein n=1 Tax=Aminobacter anthyllidis TaxID=1035067 RepID=UPI0024551405|nr:right-handed parallel beta-helix repeat-containing protein [Aminobacter anthyllidis]MDH4988619.1 right-handed parallel beta-helix repeat-containing protein [Aminobacter anthyllidis]
MKFPSLFVVALASGTALSSHAFAQAQQPILELEGNLAYGHGNGGIGIFMPFLLDGGNGVFFDASGHFVEGSARQASFGMGYRHRIENGWLLGGYGYLDVFNSEHGNTFNQLSFGVEALGPVFEARANVYLPLGDDKVAASLSHAFVSGSELKFQAGREFARTGADAEAGMRLPVFPEGINAEMKVFGGAYWYDGARGLDDTLGVKARTEVSFSGLPGVSGSTLVLGASVSYDNEDRTEFGLTARLRVPLGGSSRTGKAAFDPMFQRVERSDFVRTHADRDGVIEAAEFVHGGQAVGKVVSISSATGDAAAINAALTTAGTNALVLANGGISVSQALQLGTGQHLLGGGGSIAVRGANSRIQAAFRAGGEAASLTGTNPLANVVTMGTGSEIAGLAITGGLAGIASNGTSNLSIRNVDISKTGTKDVGGDGIRLDNVTGATIEGAKIHDLYICDNNNSCEFAVGRPNLAPHAAIAALGTNGLTIRNTVIDKVTYGIFAGSRIGGSRWDPVIANKAANIVIDNVTISRSRREGILLVAADDVKMNKVTVDNSKQGLDMDLVVLQGTSNVTIKDMTLSGGINGLMLISASTLPEGAKTTNVRVDRLKIDGTRQAGVFLNPVSDIHLKNVTVTNAGTYGAHIYGSEYEFLGGAVKDITFEDFRVDRAKAAGLYFANPVENIRGDVTVLNTPLNCLAETGNSTSLTQTGGSVLKLNGTALEANKLKTTCK